jgi:hypothetical protein
MNAPPIETARGPIAIFRKGAEEEPILDWPIKQLPDNKRINKNFFIKNSPLFN